MRLSTPMMPTPLVVPLPPGARAVGSGQAPAVPADHHLRAAAHASDAPAPGARTSGDANAAVPGSPCFGAESGAAVPGSPSFSQSSRSSTDSHAGCQLHVNAAMWPRAHQRQTLASAQTLAPLPAGTPVAAGPPLAAHASGSSARPMAGNGTAPGVCAAGGSAADGSQAAGGPTVRAGLRTVRVCADRVCGLQVCRAAERSGAGRFPAGSMPVVAFGACDGMLGKSSVTPHLALVTSS